MDILNHPKIKFLQDNVIGRDATIETPFGTKRRVYFDYIASGCSFGPIEDLIAERVLPHMANTHTESNTSGRQITYFVDEAYRSVARSLGATDEDVIIFTGAGSTSAINRLILAMGLRVPEQVAEACGCREKIPKESRPVIFRSMMEHHSNDIAWRETFGETYFVGFDKAGRIDWRDLDSKLSAMDLTDQPIRVGTFSAASNVTGILNDVDSLAEVMHAHGGLAFFDYAAAAPYVHIDLHPDGNEARRKDAVFISTHKFLGGPQTPGILAANKDLFTSNVPVEPGGGTVLYTSPWDHRYVDDVRAREGSGTPPIVQIIRAGMVFDVKDYAGADLLASAEEILTQRALARFSKNPAINVLGDETTSRLGVFSLVLNDSRLHHNLAVRLLNDRFGIQVRAGCMCAGTYGHELLEIGKEKSAQIRSALDDGKLWTKPGWVRVSLSPVTSAEDLEYLLDALDQICADWEDYVDRYRQDMYGEFFWAGKNFEETFEPLAVDFPE